MRLMPPSPSGFSWMNSYRVIVSTQSHHQDTSQHCNVTLVPGFSYGTYLAENTKEGDPQDEENRVPYGGPNTGDAHGGRDSIDDACYSRQSSYDHGIDLYCVKELQSVYQSTCRHAQRRRSSPIWSWYPRDAFSRVQDLGHIERRLLWLVQSRGNAARKSRCS